MSNDITRLMYSMNQTLGKKKNVSNVVDVNQHKGVNKAAQMFKSLITPKKTLTVSPRFIT